MSENPHVQFLWNDHRVKSQKNSLGFNTMHLDELLREVKAVAVQPVAVGILRATAHSARQAHVERFQAFAAKSAG